MWLLSGLGAVLGELLSLLAVVAAWFWVLPDLVRREDTL